MAEDPWQGKQGGLEAPARSAAVVSPSDSVNLDPPARSLYIGTAGDISVEMVGTGTAVVLTNVPVGVLPIRVSRINATGTSASGIVALW